MLSGQTASWRQAWLRALPIPLDAPAMSVIKARPAGPGEQRFGVPGNLHAFALVRCAAPGGPLDLVILLADVPLIRWFFGGQPDGPEQALLNSAISPARARRVMSRAGCWGLVTGGGVLAAAGIWLGAAPPGQPGRAPAVLLAFSGLLITSGFRHLLLARWHKRATAAR
jgi:hypothetical protein